MIVLVLEQRQDASSQRVRLVAVHRQLIDQVLAPWMHHNIEGFKKFYAFLQGLSTFYRRQDAGKAVAFHVADGLRPGAVCRDRPLLSLRYAHKQFRQVNDLTTHLIGFVVHIKAIAVNVTTNKYRGINTKAPIGTKTKYRAGACLKLFNHPVAKDSRLAVALVFPEPYMRVLVRVAGAVILHLLLQHIRKPRVVPVVGLNYHGPRRRNLRAQ